MRICRKCESEMTLVAQIPGKGKSEVREFVCPNCGAVERVPYWNGQEDYGQDKPPISEVDYHSVTAKRIFGENFTPRERYAAKLRYFSELYGGERRKLNEVSDTC